VKVLLFGATGQVGRALLASVPPDTTLVALDRAGCDLTDAQAIRAVVAAAGPDVVINAAAYTAVDAAETEPALAQVVNGIAPGMMAEAAKAARARFIHLSSDFVFDGAAGTPRRPDDPTHPLGVYGASKLAGERAVGAALPTALIVRTAWVYAARGRNFLTTMLRLTRERPEIRVVDDQIGTPTWAASLAEALWQLLAAGASGIHHFTDAGVASWYDFAVAVQEEALAMGILENAVPIVPIASAQFPTAAPRPAFSVLDKAMTTALLGSPARHWRENLRSALKEICDDG
jgi:dTDP-4-dehydrorhamnose reductase